MRWVCCIAVMSALVACNDAKKPALSAKPAVVAVASAAMTGSIEGVVVLSEGAERPLLPDPTKTGAKVTNPPAPCTPVVEGDLSPVKHNAATGGLSSVHVALTGMASTASVEPRTHELRLENCRLNQPLLGARVGDSLRISNASESPMLPSLQGDTVMEVILPRQSRTVELKSAGVSQISCKFGAFCGQTDVLVTTHSLFSVTDGNGQFRIDHVPLDRELTVHAWHPLFEESNETFTLSKDAPKRTVKLVLKPTLPESGLAEPEGADKAKP